MARAAEVVSHLLDTIEALRAEVFTAAGAKCARLCGKLIPAGVADWQAAEASKGFRAKAAFGREKDGRKGVQRTSEHANNRTPYRGIGWRNFERQRITLTAEDSPLRRQTGISYFPAPVIAQYTVKFTETPVGTLIVAFE